MTLVGSPPIAGQAANQAVFHERLRAAATCFDAACALADAWLQRPAGHPSPSRRPR
jgi:hypothetical protein